MIIVSTSFARDEQLAVAGLSMSQRGRHDRRPRPACDRDASGKARTRAVLSGSGRRLSTPAKMRLPRRPRASSACAFPLPLDQEPRAQARTEEALAPRSARARNGGPDRRDASAWSSGAGSTAAIQRRQRNAALGRARCDRRQPHRDWQRHGKEILPVAARFRSSPQRPPDTPGGLLLCLPPRATIRKTRILRRKVARMALELAIWGNLIGVQSGPHQWAKYPCLFKDLRL